MKLDLHRVAVVPVDGRETDRIHRHRHSHRHDDNDDDVAHDVTTASSLRHCRRSFLTCYHTACLSPRRFALLHGIDSGDAHLLALLTT